MKVGSGWNSEGLGADLKSLKLSESAHRVVGQRQLQERCGGRAQLRSVEPIFVAPSRR